MLVVKIGWTDAAAGILNHVDQAGGVVFRNGTDIVLSRVDSLLESVSIGVSAASGFEHDGVA